MGAPSTSDDRVQPPVYACPDCHKAMFLDLGSGHLFCTTRWCAAAGMPESVSSAERRRTGDRFAGGAPAGLPRPRFEGRPVPWITVVADGFVWWRQIDGARVRACQEMWLCQYCGLPCPPEAHVVLDVNGDIVTDSVLHEGCLAVVLRQCPALRAGTTTGSAFTTARVTAGSILADGDAYRPGVALLERQQWSLRPDHVAPGPASGKESKE